MFTGRALARDKFLAWCAQLPAGCIVAMETSSGAHHWARKLIALGLNARTTPTMLSPDTYRHRLDRGASRHRRGFAALDGQTLRRQCFAACTKS